MVIHSNGRLCTCGRRGCLEAYASVPALLKDVRIKSNEDLTLEQVFAKKSEEKVAAAIEEYAQMLSIGIVDIVNIFRPQLILIGGMMSAYADEILDELRAIVKRDSFGGDKGAIPEIAVAELGSNAGIIGAAGL